MVVIVNNKNEIPYGILSVGYFDGWRLIDYITEPQKLNYPYDLNSMWENLEKHAINVALRKGIDAKALVSPDFEAKLLSSESRRILYLSEDQYLGVNPVTKIGQNIYGKWLTTYRNMLIENKGVAYYNAFVFDRYLRVAINEEPLDYYLNLSREGVNIRQLIQILYEKYKNKIDIPSKEIVDESRKFSQKNLSYNAEDIVLNVMKTKIRNVRVNNIVKLRFEVFKKFLEKVFNKYNIRYDVNMFIRKIKNSELQYMIDIVNTKNNKNTKNNDDAIKPDIYVPSIEYIEQVDKLKYQGYTDKLPYDNGSAFIDSLTSSLSLKDDSVVINIEGKNYPSLSHYIIYCIGLTIKDFDPYVMISNGQHFYRVEDSKRFLNENLDKFRNHYISERFYQGVLKRFSEKPYTKDFFKSLHGDELILRDFQPQLSAKIYNSINIPWTDVMKDSGKVEDFVDVDPFFVFTQKEMFENFIEIYKIIFDDKKLTLERVEKVFNQFFFGGYSTDIDIINADNIAEFFRIYGFSSSSTINKFIKKKFLERILLAEQMSHKIFNSSVIFMTKFLMIFSRYKIFKGEMINPNLQYKHRASKEFLALSKVVNFIMSCTNTDIMNENHLIKAFNILNSDKQASLIVSSPTQKPQKPQIVDEEYHQSYHYHQSDNEEESDDEAEIEGYEDDAFDDLMYGRNEHLDADQMARHILRNLQNSQDFHLKINETVEKLYASETKNIYRINLWQ